MDRNSLADPKLMRFSRALGRVLQVSKDDIGKLLASNEAKAAVKAKRGPKFKHRPPDADDEVVESRIGAELRSNARE